LKGEGAKRRTLEQKGKLKRKILGIKSIEQEVKMKVELEGVK
jgi:hypothetical protein